MAQPTRRTFLAATGAGVAALGVAGLPSIATAGETPNDLPTEQAPETDGAGLLIASVTDVRSGAVTLARGEAEVVVVDHALARRIARLSTTQEA